MNEFRTPDFYTFFDRIKNEDVEMGFHTTDILMSLDKCLRSGLPRIREICNQIHNLTERLLSLYVTEAWFLMPIDKKDNINISNISMHWLLELANTDRLSFRHLGNGVYVSNGFKDSGEKVDATHEIVMKAHWAMGRLLSAPLKQWEGQFFIALVDYEDLFRKIVTWLSKPRCWSYKAPGLPGISKFVETMNDYLSLFTHNDKYSYKSDKEFRKAIAQVFTNYVNEFGASEKFTRHIVASNLTEIIPCVAKELWELDNGTDEMLDNLDMHSKKQNANARKNGYLPGFFYEITDQFKKKNH